MKMVLNSTKKVLLLSLTPLISRYRCVQGCSNSTHSNNYTVCADFCGHCGDGDEVEEQKDEVHHLNRDSRDVEQTLYDQ